ncbi:hypothetical protein [Aquimarina sp. AU474]|uniref:hypothetical protein n=1 Tax=Aquimarina sp. AU474 TaxID=2108529 RepID=UPI000D692BD9|nr:hypothetical protein [Aquimarina sp. AU474]
MNYKTKVLILSFIALFPTFVISQVRVGDFIYSKYKFNKLNKKDLNRFTNTKTTFILPEFFSKESYEKLLNQVWNVTPYRIVYRDDFTGDTIKTDDALARFKSMEIEKTTKSGMVVSYVFNFLDFHVVDKVKNKKKGKVWWKSRVGTIYFTPNIKIRQQIEASSGEREISGDLLNFRLGYLKNYLQLVNNSLKNKKSIDIYDDFISPELEKLKDQTLYIDSNLLYGYNPFTASGKKSPEIEKLTQDYTFKYEVIDYNKLEEKIFNEKNDFFYLMYNQINSNKIINIVNGKTGEIIYQKHTTVSYNLKPKDFKKIYLRINKLNK